MSRVTKRLFVNIYLSRVKKHLFIFTILLVFQFNSKATIYPIKIGTNYQSLYNLCPGDTIRFMGDSLNGNAYGSVAGYVYNNQTHSSDVFNVWSFTNIATTYDHTLALGDSCYQYNLGAPSVMFPWGLHFNCLTTALAANNTVPKFNIYPNPTTSTLNIIDEQNQLQNAIIEIKNTLGQSVLLKPFNNEIDLTYLSKGLYYLTLRDGENQKTVIFIKE